MTSKFKSDEYKALILEDLGISEQYHRVEAENEILKTEILGLKEQNESINAVLLNLIDYKDQHKKEIEILATTLKIKKVSNRLNGTNKMLVYSQSAEYGIMVYELLKSQPKRNGQIFLTASEEIRFLKSKFPELKLCKNIYQRKDRINEMMVYMFPDVEFTSEPLRKYNGDGGKIPRKLLKLKDKTF